MGSFHLIGLVAVHFLLRDMRPISVESK